MFVLPIGIILFAIPAVLLLAVLTAVRWFRIARGWHEHWSLPPRDRVIGEAFRSGVTAEPSTPRMPATVRVTALIGLIALPIAGLGFVRQCLRVREWTAFIEPSTYEFGQPLFPSYHCDGVAAPDLVAFRGLKASLLACALATLFALVACWLLPERTDAAWTHLRRSIVASQSSAVLALALLAFATIRQGIGWMWRIPVCRAFDVQVVSHAGLSRPAMSALAGIVGVFAATAWLRTLTKRHAIPARVSHDR